jgi:hypothetical protein
MAHNSSPYIDGNRGQVYRTVNGTGTNIDPHTNVIAPHDDFTSGIGSKALNVEPARYLQTIDTFPIVSGDNYVNLFDTRKLKFLSLKIINSSATFTDFIIAVSMNSDAVIWDDIANSDFHYTTGQGESTGNPMVLVRKCSPVNPRSLGSTAQTWLLLNVEPYASIYTRVVSTGSGTCTTYSYGLFN